MHQFDELLRDCSLLFGREAVVNRQFLESLQLPVLKTAFRRRALLTHPDLFSGQGQAVQRHYAEMFMGASEAYKRLSQFIVTRASIVQPTTPLRPSGPRNSSAGPRPTPPPPPPPFSSQRQRSAGSAGERNPFTRPSADFGFSSSPRIYVPSLAPGWPLRTGEFLYYAKVISWKLLIAAIVWQRQQRERIGEIAQRWGWLSESEILEINSQRYLGERLGEVLVRHEWITQFQLSMLLWQQRKSQSPIGRFFIHRGLLSESGLQRCLADLSRHNQKWRSRRSADPFGSGSAAGPFGKWKVN